MKESSFKANGTAEVSYYSQMRLLTKEYGYKIQNNDDRTYYLSAVIIIGLCIKLSLLLFINSHVCKEKPITLIC